MKIFVALILLFVLNAHAVFQFSPSQTQTASEFVEKWSNQQKMQIIFTHRELWWGFPFQQSVYLNWEQFVQPGAVSRGYFYKDELAVKSILENSSLDPDIETFIVGKGIKGRGEEGRLALTLLSWGFKKIKITTIGTLKKQGYPIDQIKPAKKIQFKKISFSTKYISTESDPKKLFAHTNLIIDVRPTRTTENIKYPASMYAYKPHILNYQWKDFFTEDLILKPLDAAIEKKIKSYKTITVISYAGLASSLVVLALRQHGYDQVYLYEGGFSDLEPGL